METLEIALDESGNKVVVLPEIIFSNKQKIDWNEVEATVQGYYLAGKISRADLDCIFQKYGIL